MSKGRWAYVPNICNNHYCCGDCDNCDMLENPEKYSLTEDEESFAIQSARKGEE